MSTNFYRYSVDQLVDQRVSEKSMSTVYRLTVKHFRGVVGVVVVVDETFSEKSMSTVYRLTVAGGGGRPKSL